MATTTDDAALRVTGDDGMRRLRDQIDSPDRETAREARLLREVGPLQPSWARMQRVREALEAEPPGSPYLIDWLASRRVVAVAALTVALACVAWLRAHDASHAEEAALGGSHGPRPRIEQSAPPSSAPLNAANPVNAASERSTEAANDPRAAAPSLPGAQPNGSTAAGAVARNAARSLVALPASATSGHAGDHEAIDGASTDHAAVVSAAPLAGQVGIASPRARAQAAGAMDLESTDALGSTDTTQKTVARGPSVESPAVPILVAPRLAADTGPMAVPRAPTATADTASTGGALATPSNPRGVHSGTGGGDHFAPAATPVSPKMDSEGTVAIAFVSTASGRPVEGELRYGGAYGGVFACHIRHQGAGGEWASADIEGTAEAGGGVDLDGDGKDDVIVEPVSETKGVDGGLESNDGDRDGAESAESIGGPLRVIVRIDD